MPDDPLCTVHLFLHDFTLDDIAKLPNKQNIRMSNIRVNLNASLSENWQIIRALFEEEVKASFVGETSKSGIRSSSTQDAEFAAHLLDVHRKWCETCPTPSRGRRGRPDTNLAPDGFSTAGVHSTPTESCVSSSKQTAPNE